jgi:hypothetical protein
MPELLVDKIARIELELASLRAARLAAAQGKQVEDVWRDGRRVRYTAFSLDDWNRHETYLEGQLYAARVEAGEDVSPRRTAIGVGY